MQKLAQLVQMLIQVCKFSTIGASVQIWIQFMKNLVPSVQIFLQSVQVYKIWLNCAHFATIGQILVQLGNFFYNFINVVLHSTK